jgi:hypothetical protein
VVAVHLDDLTTIGYSADMTLVGGGQTLESDAGDVAVFRGDQRHSSRNPGRVRAVGYRIVLLAGPAP